MPKYSGMLTMKSKDSEIQPRIQRKGIVNEKTTTAAQFYLRSRERNAERQPAYVRTKYG